MQRRKPGCAPRTLKFSRVASLIDVICPWPGRWRALLWMKWRVIDRRKLPLTLSLESICPWPSHWKALLWMKWMPDTPHTPPPSPIPVGKGSASFFGQQDAVYVTLVTLDLHVHFPTATFSTHWQTKIYCKHSHKFQSHIGGCNPSPTIQPRKHTYTTIQFHANSCMYVYTCVCTLS